MVEERGSAVATAAAKVPIYKTPANRFGFAVLAVILGQRA